MTLPYLNNDVATMKKSRLWQVGNTSHRVQDVAPCRRQTSNIIDAIHAWKKVCPCTKALLLSGGRA